MTFDYTELDVEDSLSNDGLEKVGFLTEEKHRVSRYDRLRGSYSLKIFATVLPWLLVIGLALALTYGPKSPSMSGCAEFELDRYCM